MFDFSIADYADAYAAARAFFMRVRDDGIAREVIYVPGNHDWRPRSATGSRGARTASWLEFDHGRRASWVRAREKGYTGGVRFEWDPAKARRNAIKHGVRFSEAATVFGDPLAATVPDPDRPAREARFLTVGHARSGRLLIVAHADRHGRIRLLSARTTTPRERKAYEENT